MMLTRTFEKSIRERVKSDRDFKIELLVEAANSFLQGEPETARLILRDLVNATVGFEALAKQLGVPAGRLHSMLSVTANPSMSHLSAIFEALQKELKVSLLAEAKIRG